MKIMIIDFIVIHLAIKVIMRTICMRDVVELLNEKKKRCEKKSSEYTSVIDWNYDSGITAEENTRLINKYEKNEKKWLGCYILLNAIRRRKHLIPYTTTVYDYIEYLFRINDSIITRAYEQFISEFPMYEEVESDNLVIPIYPINLGF